MSKRIDRILDNAECSFAGVFVGNSLFAVWDHLHDRGSHSKKKQPWYQEIILDGLFTCSVLLTIESVKLIIQSDREAQKGKHK